LVCLVLDYNKEYVKWKKPRRLLLTSPSMLRR
jgi:hypothetical protein